MSRSILERAGYEVLTAEDGVQALATLSQQPCDLVLTDLEMPRVHGYELIREMQYLPAYSAIPVVVISSRSRPRFVISGVRRRSSSRTPVR